ncbi:trafficking protein particle complex subunit 11 [Geosmithia morbida]|uniref:Trafficking protein particle complex subunit 11 n=1 Tax=Geosmithia morbida TaxID=1094350 RepID=A0A9P4Z2R2_9HYPO|nr:trafficking protein particle complex subunit 11 [Geosmithia morbida]KAF4125564.1 trafficking protein particle complex subunit 11 [Geosmithia morbida]
MDAYPDGSLDHNVPLLVVSGLNSSAPQPPLGGELKDQGILVRSALPPVETREAAFVEQYLDKVNERGRSWVAVRTDEPYRFRVKTVGRSFLLPPRLSPLPESSDQISSPPVLHSPFSPLSHVSSTYPDGLIDAQWIKKHQEFVPGILLCFYTISTDPTTTTLQDNRLKADIASMKNTLTNSGYRTRLAVALLTDEDSTPATQSMGLQDRLENIRRGSGLDPKSLFYIPPQESPAELKAVVDGILSALDMTALEYYRDLGRHARKKRSRGIAPQPTVPPTTGTSRTLSLSGWNFRYDFKSAVLGEFRQEYEPALKSYEQAYDGLLGEDVIEAVPSWNPRWNEARILADVIAIRCLRIYMWLDQTTLAVRKWQSHRDRIADLVERLGRGTDNYGWEAFEARWALIMAQLMDRIELRPGIDPSSDAPFLPAEKDVVGDRLHPWELLHHKGYWYRIAARHLDARRRLARTIPDEDRVEPRSGAAQNASAGSSYNYDTYLCPKPYEELPLDGAGVNHSQLILDCLIPARSQFQARKQLRTAAEISLDCAKEMERMKSWKEVLAVLRPLWEDGSFRSEGWVQIAEDMCWLMRRAAVEEGRGELVVALDWELMNKKFRRRPQWHYDLSKSLDGIEMPNKPSISLSDTEVPSFVDAAFLFRNKESKAGQRCACQLILTSQAFPDATPITLKDVQVEFEGSLRPIVLEHAASQAVTTEGRTAKSTTALKECFEDESADGLPSILRGKCDLTLQPLQTRVFEMSIPLREAGEVSTSSVRLSFGSEKFDMDYKMNLDSHSAPGWFANASTKPKHPRSNAHVLQVQPRPPKVDIRVVDLLNQYYANEEIELHIQIHNAEDEAATIKLDTHLFGKTLPGFTAVADIEDGERKAGPGQEESRAAGLPLGRVESSSTMDVRLKIDPTDMPTTYDVHLRALYHLESDPATPIMQLLPVQINVASAFEANYSLMPRLHPDPWPSLFDYENVPTETGDEEQRAVQGLAQNWSLACHYASFATEDVKVVGMRMKVLSGSKYARCHVTDGPDFSSQVVSPKVMHEAHFNMTAQRLSLDDRHPVIVELGVEIQWQRLGDPERPTNTTTMVAGQYPILGSEPRVLASVFDETTTTTSHNDEGGSDSDDDDRQLMLHLEITIENPSNHFLTFGLTMEPSDEFAFSGAKQTSLHLLPMSRRSTTYRLLPLVRGTFIRPGLVVRDKYFQKVLRIIPTQGMKLDKEGLLIWVPPEDEGDDEEEQEGENSGPAE